MKKHQLAEYMVKETGLYEMYKSDATGTLEHTKSWLKSRTRLKDMEGYVTPNDGKRPEPLFYHPKQE